MARKKRLKIWQIWHVEFARPASRRTDGDRRCYQIIARLDRQGKNYWVAVDTTADPPMRSCLALFDDYGREVESHNAKWSPTGKPAAPSTMPTGRNPERKPRAKAGARVEGSRVLSKRCLHRCFFKTHMTYGST